MKGRTTAEWLRATDTDIWHEIKQAEAKFTIQGIKYKVRWVRSLGGNAVSGAAV